MVAKNWRRIFSASFWAPCRHNFKYEDLTSLFGGLLRKTGATKGHNRATKGHNRELFGTNPTIQKDCTETRSQKESVPY